MQTFAAQVKTGDLELDVSITLSGRSVQIDAGRDRLGTWNARECRFDRLAEHAYEIRLPNESVHARIPDDKGFRAALELLREEQGVLVPRPLLWLGVGAVAAAVVVSSLIAGEPAAEAQPPDASATTSPTTAAVDVPVTTVVATTTTTTVIASDTEVLRSWNDLAGGTPLELDGIGRNELDDAVVTIQAGRVEVEAVPDGTSDNAEMIMSALGIAVASSDPIAAPAERAGVLADLGLRINAPNTAQLHTDIVHNGVHYHLDFEPATSVRFEAGRGR